MQSRRGSPSWGAAGAGEGSETQVGPEGTAGAEPGERRGSSAAAALPAGKPSHIGAPAHPAPTHHQQNPEEGHEVAGLGGLQLEEVHADDGEHDHEEPCVGWGWREAGVGHARTQGRRKGRCPGQSPRRHGPQLLAACSRFWTPGGQPATHLRGSRR